VAEAGIPILIAGAKGQLARALAERAARHGFKAVALGRPALDLTKPETIRDAFSKVDPAFVINAAAATGVDQAESDPAAAFAVNRDGAAALAAETYKRKLPFLHVSTDYVFDGEGGAPYAEGAPVNPLGVYGRSKLEGEMAVLESHPKAIICRTSWVFSPWPKNFALTMLQYGQERDELKVVNDQHGRPTYALDLADALLDLGALASAVGPGDLPRILHVANSGEATWCEFAAAILGAAKQRGRKVAKLEPIPTSAYPTPARRPADSRLDCTQATLVLGRSLRDWRAAVEDWAGRVINA
jgi:dTDP-4-dehydrorhamnose reductase